jgi:hypothetical protein
VTQSLAQVEALFWHTARGRLDRAAVEREFRSAGALDAVQRMALYRDMYFARQLQALRATFPLLERELGEARFLELAHAYLIAHPSAAPAIEWVGERLPQYLRAQREEPRRVELAELEWLACRALLAPHE